MTIEMCRGVFIEILVIDVRRNTITSLIHHLTVEHRTL